MPFETSPLALVVSLFGNSICIVIIFSFQALRIEDQSKNGEFSKRKKAIDFYSNDSIPKDSPCKYRFNLSLDIRD